MQQLDKLLNKLKEDGFKFGVNETEWGQRQVGTKDRGTFRKPEKILIWYFAATNPSPVQFGNFIRDAEKFYEKNGIDFVVKEIYLITPSDIDRRRAEFRIFLEKADREMASLLRYKSLGVPEVSVETAPPATKGSRRLPHLSEIDASLQNRSAKERTLMVMDTSLEKGGTRTPSLLAFTQERGVVFRQIDGQLVPQGLEFKWEHDPHFDLEDKSGGESALVINDGKKVYEFVHPEAEYLVSLLNHLKWARKEYLVGNIEEHGFDPDLIAKAKKEMLDGRHTDAVRSAFALLESRIRRDSFAPATLHGRDLIDYAFSANDGKINFGRIEPEKNGLYMLFAGTFAWLRNPASHTSELRNFGKEDAFEVLALINHLLKLSQRGNEEARNRPI